MSARDELARVIVDAYGEDSEKDCPCVQDLEVADAVLAAGYRKPRVLGYIVVEQRVGMCCPFTYATAEAAQGEADRWNAESKENQHPADYRVAEIVEAAA